MPHDPFSASQHDSGDALSAMAARYSSAAVTMGHLALKRAIRHAEAGDVVNRNVATLADTPRGQEGRPSRYLTPGQPAAIIAAARTLPVIELRPGLKDVRRPAELMYGYIVVSLLVGLRTEEARALRKPEHCAGITSTSTATPITRQPCRRTWPSGARSAHVARPRPSAPAAPSPCRN